MLNVPQIENATNHRNKKLIKKNKTILLMVLKMIKI